MTAGQLPIRNVLATLRGSTDPERLVVISDKVDHWATLGKRTLGG
jgi:hypothetical protein